MAALTPYSDSSRSDPNENVRRSVVHAGGTPENPVTIGENSEQNIFAINGVSRLRTGMGPNQTATMYNGELTDFATKVTSTSSTSATAGSTAVSTTTAKSTTVAHNVLPANPASTQPREDLYASFNRANPGANLQPPAAPEKATPAVVRVGGTPENRMKIGAKGKLFVGGTEGTTDFHSNIGSGQNISMMNNRLTHFEAGPATSATTTTQSAAATTQSSSAPSQHAPSKSVIKGATFGERCKVNMGVTGGVQSVFTGDIGAGQTVTIRDGILTEFSAPSAATIQQTTAGNTTSPSAPASTPSDLYVAFHRANPNTHLQLSRATPVPDARIGGTPDQPLEIGENVTYSVISTGRDRDPTKTSHYAPCEAQPRSLEEGKRGTAIIGPVVMGEGAVLNVVTDDVSFCQVGGEMSDGTTTTATRPNARVNQSVPTRVSGTPTVINGQIVYPAASHTSKPTPNTATTQLTTHAFQDNPRIGTLEVSPNLRGISLVGGKNYSVYGITHSMKNNRISLKSKLGSLEHAFTSPGLYYLGIKSGKLIITKKDS